jgi:tripartite-type tricarboxylate transporter receptor subunit TctC
MASGGVGTPGHVAGELFKIMTGVNLVHVPYRGEGPALTDAISGQVQLMFVSVTPSLEFIRAGKLRALAVTTTARSPAMPDVPTIAETVPGYEVNGWAGMGAPKGTPSEIIQKLNDHINAGLASPGIKARYADLGITPLVLSPSDFGKFIADQTDKWAKVIRAANIKPE